MSADVSTRPSDARRAALRDADAALGNGAPLVSNFFPIERYYDAAEKVLQSFYEAYELRQLDDAYVYGKRFAAFSLDALPAHNYYKSSKYKELRNKNNADMAEVVRRLEKVAEWMDQEEIQKEKERRKREEEWKRQEQERLRRLREHQKAEERRRQAELKERLRRMNQSEANSSSSLGENIEESAMNKLERLKRHSREEEESDLMDSFDSVSTPSNNPNANFMDGTMRIDEGGEYRNGDDGRSQRRVSRRPKEGGEARRRPSSRGSAADEERYARRERRRRESNGDDHDRSRRKSISPKPIRRPSTHTNGGLPDALPPPLAPPDASGQLPPPPSYNDVVAGPQQNGVAAAAGGAITRKGPSVRESMPAPPSGPVEDPPVPSYAASQKLQKQRRAKKPQSIPFRKLKEKAIMDYRALRKERKIEVLPIPTYQGRSDHSTNGCAVISPLVVSHHLRSPPSVSDSEIVAVIDNECNSLLRAIRGKLELGDKALIIPSDVHDHLVDKKILSQNWFIGAQGGNIFDPKHIGEFIKMIESGENNSHKDKKTGAAFFFREHVVSIVKVPAGNGKFYYDLVDSLPHYNLNGRQASRTRCKDIAAFESLLRWHAATNLTESNGKYIDRNEWDEDMADFDPRVFQGFVWGEVVKDDSKK